MPSGASLHGVITENGHKVAALLHASLFFFLTVISLLFSIGIESTSDVVFASSVQKLSLIIYGHLYFLFYVLFCIEVITVYSINFPLLFSSSFFIF